MNDKKRHTNHSNHTNSSSTTNGTNGTADASLLLKKAENRYMYMSSALKISLFFCCCWYFIVPYVNLGHLTWVRHNSCKRRATQSYQCVQYFCVSKQCYGCQCLGFLMYTQKLVHAVAHGGCTDIVREPWKLTGRKIPCRIRDLNPHQFCAWFVSRTLYELMVWLCPVNVGLGRGVEGILFASKHEIILLHIRWGDVHTCLLCA